MLAWNSRILCHVYLYPALQLRLVSLLIQQRKRKTHRLCVTSIRRRDDEWEREALLPLKLFVWSDCLKASKRTIARTHINPFTVTIRTHKLSTRAFTRTNKNTKTHKVEQTQIRRTETTLSISCSFTPVG